MATESQIKNFKENPECIELAILMANTIYPKIIGLLKQLGMEEVRLDTIVGLKNMCLNINGEIVFYNLENEGKDEKKADTYVIEVLGKSICPYFEKETDSITKEHESPSKKYLDFCKSIISSIEPLETQLKEINNVLNIARQINIPLQRIILIEKTNVR